MLKITISLNEIGHNRDNMPLCIPIKAKTFYSESFVDNVVA